MSEIQIFSFPQSSFQRQSEGSQLADWNIDLKICPGSSLDENVRAAKWKRRQQTGKSNHGSKVKAANWEIKSKAFLKSSFQGTVKRPMATSNCKCSTKTALAKWKQFKLIF